VKLKLHRSACGEFSTLGDLYVDGKWFCFVLEDADRKLEDNPEAKVYGETCIPRGEYGVIITYSNRFKVEMPLVLEVPGFVGIRIHPGNEIADTHGCLLVGSSWSRDTKGNYMVLNSRATYNKLFELIDAALEAKDIVRLEVV
jgi:hypothetical protein